MSDDTELLQRIGGSDIPKLLGVTKHGGPFEVYQRIVEHIDEPGRPVMWRGNAMEPVLRAHGQRLLGWDLEDLPDTDYMNSAAHEFARAQIDDLARWQGIPIVVEYKSQNKYARGWARSAGGDLIPPTYAAQVAWQLLCADRDLAIVVAGFGLDLPDGDFDLLNISTFEVHRDLEFEAYCLHVAREFWEQHVIRRVPPLPRPATKRRAS